MQHNRTPQHGAGGHLRVVPNVDPSRPEMTSVPISERQADGEAMWEIRDLKARLMVRPGLSEALRERFEADVLLLEVGAQLRAPRARRLVVAR